MFVFAPWTRLYTYHCLGKKVRVTSVPHPDLYLRYLIISADPDKNPTPASDPDPSIQKQKTLISTLLWLLNNLLSLKTNVKAPVSNKPKYFFVGILKATEIEIRIRTGSVTQWVRMRGSGSVIVCTDLDNNQTPASDPDPCIHKQKTWFPKFWEHLNIFEDFNVNVPTVRISKNTSYFLLAVWKPLKKIAGSGSVTLWYGSGSVMKTSGSRNTDGNPIHLWKIPSPSTYPRGCSACRSSHWYTGTFRWSTCRALSSVGRSSARRSVGHATQPRTRTRRTRTHRAHRSLGCTPLQHSRKEQVKT